MKRRDAEKWNWTRERVLERRPREPMKRTYETKEMNLRTKRDEWKKESLKDERERDGEKMRKWKWDVMKPKRKKERKYERERDRKRKNENEKREKRTCYKKNAREMFHRQRALERERSKRERERKRVPREKRKKAFPAPDATQWRVHERKLREGKRRKACPSEKWDERKREWECAEMRERRDRPQKKDLCSPRERRKNKRKRMRVPESENRKKTKKRERVRKYMREKEKNETKRELWTHIMNVKKENLWDASMNESIFIYIEKTRNIYVPWENLRKLYIYMRNPWFVKKTCSRARNHMNHILYYCRERKYMFVYRKLMRKRGNLSSSRKERMNKETVRERE